MGICGCSRKISLGFWKLLDVGWRYVEYARLAMLNASALGNFEWSILSSCLAGSGGVVP